MSKYHILLVEDEPGLVLTLTDLLMADGYEVEHAGDFDTAENMIKNGTYDAIILDIMLPGGSGFDILRNMRAEKNLTPVLVLTARTAVPEKVVGLKLGADDYMGKPFDSMELLARIEALVRRNNQIKDMSHNDTHEIFAFGDIEINYDRDEVKKDGTIIPLTVQEYRLLCYLVANKGKTISRDKLLDEVWGYDQDVASRTVDVHVSSLRQKIGDDSNHPRWVVTVRGFGYRFELDH